MTTVHRDEHIFMGSGRQVGSGLVRDTFTVSTTDATATLLKRVPLGEGQVVQVRVFAAGKKADLSAAAGVSQTATFRRAAAGNVTLVGALQGTTQEDHAGAPAIALSANATAQSVDLSVTGVAAESWQWVGHVEFIKF